MSSEQQTWENTLASNQPASGPMTISVRIEAHVLGADGWCSACKRRCRRGAVIRAKEAPEFLFMFCRRCVRKIGAAK